MILMPRNIDMTLYNTLKWGCECEGTGITRYTCAKVVATHFGTSYNHEGGAYDKYTVSTPDGVWSIMRDSSVTPLRKSDGRIVSAGDEYRVEIVTPPLKGGGAIAGFQEVIRKLRKAGFFPCATAGFHVHVEIANLKPDAIIHIFNQIYSHQDMMLASIGLSSSDLRYRYCEKIPVSLVKKLKDLKRRKKDSLTLKDIAEVYYPVMGSSSEMYTRYPSARYYVCNATRGLVKDSRFYLGTIEFRMFNSDNHAGKLKSYIQWCLLLVQYCASISKSSYKEMPIDDMYSTKYRWRCFLLKIGAIGDEFKTLRLFLLERFGDQSSAWRRGMRV